MDYDELRMRALQISAQITRSSDLNEIFHTSDKIIEYVQDQPKQQSILDNTALENVFNQLSVYRDKPSEFIKQLCDIPLYVSDDFMKEYYNNIISTMHNNTASFIFIPNNEETYEDKLIRSYLIYCSLIKPNQQIMIVSGSFKDTKHILTHIRHIYDTMPEFLRCGISKCNMDVIEFKNGSRIMIRSCTEHATRGMSLDILYVYEASYISHKIFHEFYTSAMPSLVGTKGKFIISCSSERMGGLLYQIWHANSTFAKLQRISTTPITWKVS